MANNHNMCIPFDLCFSLCGRKIGDIIVFVFLNNLSIVLKAISNCKCFAVKLKAVHRENETSSD